MSVRQCAVATWFGVAGVVLGACGGPGLPPAGPAPGEVEIGYGTQPADKVTGAVSTVSKEEIGKSRPLHIEQLLAQVPGLQVLKARGGPLRYRLRGTNSLMSNQDPLFVIDGVPLGTGSLESALAGLTLDDIRQVDVLKDVASTAIYGSRGAGGVILITTHR